MLCNSWTPEDVSVNQRYLVEQCARNWNLNVVDDDNSETEIEVGDSADATNVLDFGAGQNQNRKVARRLPGWAENRNCAPHRIIRAFLRSKDADGVSSFGEIQRLCSDAERYPDMFVEKFNGCWASLKTDRGNSYGCVFQQEGDAVSVSAEINEILQPLVPLFLN